MGDMADGILDGTFDSVTGEYIGDGDGYPRTIHRPRKTDNKILVNTLAVFQKQLIEHGYIITIIKDIDYGKQIRTVSGNIINIYTSGKFCIQGKQDAILNSIFIK